MNKKYGATNKKPVAAPHLAQPQSFVSHTVNLSHYVYDFVCCHRFRIPPSAIQVVTGSTFFVFAQVIPSDTIQGLSLRYGVTPELIKRFNNLFTNDSIHLKTCIKIPGEWVSDGKREKVSTYFVYTNLF